MHEGEKERLSHLLESGGVHIITKVGETSSGAVFGLRAEEESVFFLRFRHDPLM